MASVDEALSVIKGSFPAPVPCPPRPSLCSWYPWGGGVLGISVSPPSRSHSLNPTSVVHLVTFRASLSLSSSPFLPYSPHPSVLQSRT